MGLPTRATDLAFEYVELVAEGQDLGTRLARTKGSGNTGPTNWQTCPLPRRAGWSAMIAWVACSTTTAGLPDEVTLVGVTVLFNSLLGGLLHEYSRQAA